MNAFGDLVGIFNGADVDWMSDAGCRDSDPEVWFPGVDGSAKPAKRICRRCPVIADCLAYALDFQSLGIWGGTSEMERRRLRVISDDDDLNHAA